MEDLGTFECHTNYNDQITSVMFKLFAWKFYISSMLPIIIDSKFVFSSRRQSGTTFDDFTTAWYVKKGYPIVLGKLVDV